MLYGAPFFIPVSTINFLNTNKIASAQKIAAKTTLIRISENRRENGNQE